MLAISSQWSFQFHFGLDYAWNPEKIGADDFKNTLSNGRLHSLEINMQKKLLR
jgi:hypothetical protein